MAEKYGEIPKKFTKAWWEYFWYYHKWHVLGTAFVVFCIVITAVQCATKPQYDFTVIYGGEISFENEASQTVVDALQPFAEDIDGNGEAAVQFIPMTITGMTGQEQYDYALQTKLDLSLQDDCTFLFLFGKAQLETMINRNYVENIYLPVSEWGFPIAEDMELIEGKEGVAYAVDLTNSKYLKEKGVYCKEVYATLRQNLKTDEENVKAYKCSLNMLREIVK